MWGTRRGSVGASPFNYTSLSCYLLPSPFFSLLSLFIFLSLFLSRGVKMPIELKRQWAARSQPTNSNVQTTLTTNFGNSAVHANFDSHVTSSPLRETSKRSLLFLSSFASICNLCQRTSYHGARLCLISCCLKTSASYLTKCQHEESLRAHR